MQLFMSNSPLLKRDKQKPLMLKATYKQPKVLKATLQITVRSLNEDAMTIQNTPLTA